MKIKPIFVGIAVVGILLLILSLSTVAKVLGANPREVLAGVKAQPIAVKFLPMRSPLFLSFLINPEKLGLFAQLAAKPSDRNNVRHDLANLKQQLQQNWLLDYDRDIQPWIDREITVAVTNIDLDDQPINGLQTGYLLAFAAKDVDLAKTSIDAFWQRLAVNGSDLGFEQYQGVSILSTSFAEDKPAIAGTVLDKFVLFANDARVLRNAIATLQTPDTSMASLATYRDRLSQLETGKNTGKVGVAYVNLAEFGEELPKESLLMSLSFDKSGIRAKTALTLASNKDGSAAVPEAISQSIKTKSSRKSSGNIANAIPSGSSVIIGNNLGQTLEEVRGFLIPEWKQSLEEAIMSVPFESNALAWAQNDFAIALLPKTNNNPNSDPNSDPDWLIVANVEDTNITKSAIADFDDIARANLTVGKISLNEQPVTIWTKLSASDSSGVSGNIVAAHTQTKDYLYLSNSLTVLNSALTIKKNQSIAASKNFKTMLAKLPSDRLTYGYIDQDFDFSWLQTSILNLKNVNQISQDISNSPLTQVFQHTELIGFTNNDRDEGMMNGELSLIFK
jgi:hypothetical protein